MESIRSPQPSISKCDGRLLRGLPSAGAVPLCKYRQSVSGVNKTRALFEGRGRFQGQRHELSAYEKPIRIVTPPSFIFNKTARHVHLVRLIYHVLFAIFVQLTYTPLHGYKPQPNYGHDDVSTHFAELILHVLK